jgi:hypothetical protein
MDTTGKLPSPSLDISLDGLHGFLDSAPDPLAMGTPLNTVTDPLFDLDQNGIPDRSDPAIDLDHSGVSDRYDIRLDLDGNGLPDRLDPSVDINHTGGAAPTSGGRMGTGSRGTAPRRAYVRGTLRLPGFAGGPGQTRGARLLWLSPADLARTPHHATGAHPPLGV